MTEIPEQMKRDNWAFFVLARSNDPTVMIPYTRKLVSNLLASMRIAGENEYNALLIRSLSTSNEAWAKYSSPGNSEWGAAVQDCEGVLDQVTFLVYERRWAIPQQDSFKYPIKEKVP